MRAIYLDHNATTPLRREAADAVSLAMKECGNASSVHWAGRRARARIDDARGRVANLVGAAPADVVFTSGGTEANNLALGGLPGRRLIVSAVEHGSVLAVPGDADICPVDEDGRIDLDALQDMLGKSDLPALLSLMAANNETGVIQPVAEAAEICREFGAALHCDAVQAAGTENLPGIAGFGAAAEIAAGAVAEMVRLADMRDGIEERIGGSAKIYGAGAPRIGNTSCIGMQGVASETQVMAFDLDGIMVSAGAACSSGKVTPSHVLGAMGVTDEQAAQAIRVSLGWDSETADADEFVAAWQRLFVRLGPKQATAA